MSRLRSLAAVLALSLSACASAGPAVKPTVTAPSAFSPAGAAALPDQWWRSFGDPVLAQLITRGLADNPGLLATWARLDGAAAGARVTGANAYPTLSGSIGGDAGKSRGQDFSSSLSVGLSASYEIDLWGRLDADRDAATLRARASEMDLRAAAITLSGEIAVAYYGLISNHAQRELLDRQMALAERSLELTRQRFERGLVAQVDVLRQEQLVESIRGDAAQADEAIALAEHRLAILVGRPPTEKVVDRAVVLPALPALPATGVPSELLQRRPDLVAAHLAIQAADREVASAVAEQYPRLSLGASASSLAVSSAGLFETWALNLAANLVAPLVDGGARAAAVDVARANLRAVVHNYSTAVLTALGEVENALVSEAKQRDALASLDRQLELSRQVLVRVEQAYNAGMTDYLRVIEAQESLQGLERQLLAARLSLVNTRIALCRALAGGWELTRPAAARA